MRKRSLILLMAVALAPSLVAAEGTDQAPVCDEAANRAEEARLADMTAAHVERVIVELGKRRDADSLLAMAMYGRMPTFGGASGSDADNAVVAVAVDAAAAPDAGPHVLLRVIALDAVPDDVRAAASERLRKMASGNLAVALTALPDAPAAAADPDRFDRWLAAAATVDHHYRYLARVVTLLADAHDAARLDPALATMFDEAANGIAAGMIAAMAAEMALYLPNFLPLTEQCSPVRANRWNALRRRHCLHIARVLADGSDTVMDASIGHGIWRRLAAATGTEAEFVASARRHYWQYERSSALMTESIDGDARYTQLLREMLAAGHGERDAARVWLEQNNVPLEPPPDWLPINPTRIRPQR